MDLISVTDLRRLGDGHRYVISAAAGNVVLPTLNATVTDAAEELPPEIGLEVLETGFQVAGLTTENRAAVEAILKDSMVAARDNLERRIQENRGGVWPASETTIGRFGRP
jgi:hypothetical protein